MGRLATSTGWPRWEKINIIGMLSAQIEERDRLGKVITNMMEIFVSGLAGLLGLAGHSVDNKN